MFIKLTRPDNSPIWINASFVVTVEPRKNAAGAIVVPIGDGLDYDVRESVDEVLAQLGMAPAPAVVPVPAPRGLAPKAAEFAPESAVPDPDVKPAEHPRTRKSESATAKRSRATGKTKKSAPVTLTAEQLERLRRMAPGSVRKLHNTLSTQFAVADPKGMVESLVEQRELRLSGNHVDWGSSSAASASAEAAPGTEAASETEAES